MYEKEGVPLPMICIMLEGGSQSIEMALNSLRMGQPLVVIKGEQYSSNCNHEFILVQSSLEDIRFYEDITILTIINQLI